MDQPLDVHQKRTKRKKRNAQLDAGERNAIEDKFVEGKCYYKFWIPGVKKFKLDVVISVVKNHFQIDKYQECSEDLYLINLIIDAQRGNLVAVEQLLKEFKNIVIFHSSKYYLKGSEKDDMVQEAMIGLFKAIRDYNIHSETSFKVFAHLCIKRQLITALKSTTRQKHQLHLNSLSLNNEIDDENKRKLIDLIFDDKNRSPEDELLAKERMKEIKGVMAKNLSQLEYKTFQLYCDGFSYQEIATILSRSIKSIDASLHRAKKKLKKLLSNIES